MRSALVAFCGLLAVAAASRFTLDTRSYMPTEWKQGNRAAPSLKIGFKAALVQQNLAELDARFWSISTPGMPLYGQFMSLEELNELIGTPAHQMSAALAEFNAVPGVKCVPFVDALKCEATVSSIESLFQTELYTFDNVDDGRKAVVYTGSLSLPAHLEGIVTMVEGFSRFPTPFTVAKHGLSADTGAVDYVIAPESLVGFYSLTGAAGSSKVIQSVAEFQNEPSYTPAELTTFEKETDVPAINVVKRVGPFSPGGDPESSLDIQYIGSVAHGNQNWFITEADWLYSFASEFNNMTSVPSIISMSYGWYENDQCSIETDPSLCPTSYDYVARVNTEFQKLGARGISLLASSGDSGAHGRTDINCQYKVLRPAYPAASPYVTAVGATMIKAGTGKIGGKSPVCTKAYAKQCALAGTEIVASCATGALITSGGGFSNVAPRPSYQDAAVQKYLATKAALPPAGDFNETGRGFPDVAALGHNYFIEAGGAGLVDGTSCSAPVWGGIFGLLNSYLATNNKPLLGFANPTLYKIYEADASAFTDVTEGDNTCTEDTCSCSPGFKAAAGWDAATGLGSPVYPKLLAGLKALKGIN